MIFWQNPRIIAVSLQMDRKIGCNLTCQHLGFTGCAGLALAKPNGPGIAPIPTLTGSILTDAQPIRKKRITAV